MNILSKLYYGRYLSEISEEKYFSVFCQNFFLSEFVGNGLDSLRKIW